MIIIIIVIIMIVIILIIIIIVIMIIINIIIIIIIIILIRIILVLVLSMIERWLTNGTSAFHFLILTLFIFLPGITPKFVLQLHQAASSDGGHPSTRAAFSPGSSQKWKSSFLLPPHQFNSDSPLEWKYSFSPASSSYQYRV